MTSALDLLKSNLPHLSDNDRGFAQSMIQQHTNRGSLSSKQWEWVDRLNDRATKAQVPQVAADVGDFHGVVALFESARKKLSAKKMKIRLMTDDGLPVALSMPERGKYAGDVYVTNGRGYSTGESVFYGHVAPTGQFQASPRASASVVAILRALAERPAETAAAYGKLHGSCCFCGKPLEDQRSLTVGYGPVCAANYDLPWGEMVKEETTQFNRRVYSGSAQNLPF